MTGEFIKRPLLPESDVTLCAVSEDAVDIIRLLEERGIAVIRVRKAENLPDMISSHADLQVLPLGDECVAVNEAQEEVISMLEKRGFRVIKVGGFGKKYPDDCVLNLLPFGDMLIGKRSVIPQELIDLGRFRTVNVRQGYCRCSSLLLDDQTVLTDDKSIGDTVLNFAKFTIILKQKEILLEGYDHGFIGGSCGKLSEKEIAFAGIIPDSEFGYLLKKELTDHGFFFRELGKEPLRDIGGIVPLKQKRAVSEQVYG